MREFPFDLKFHEFIQYTVTDKQLVKKVLKEFHNYENQNLKSVFKNMSIWNLVDLLKMIKCIFVIVKKTFFGHQLVVDTR